ncbi:chemotaxis protein CheW [Oscillatoria acuminata]|uniref:Chemotaxis signal transduction protein n=1 Tax=Oscillatoria acuminata PCC 6304 TaxID=56110 RepID=K9TFX6_9CYAN|nr:chemotaxis protein CheW [Oscillatoria acuminata]AFY81051.1 chemotaxis signal transduction protein [Oscillatoria acuminata PCC 6304]
MLMLLFYVGPDRYALGCSQVVEVIPLVELRKLYHAPEYMAGLFNYRGSIVPVLDLCHLIQGNCSRHCLSTRIILVNYQQTNQNSRLIGLMAERVTDTVDILESEFKDEGIHLENAAYLGKILMDEKGTIQELCLESLLSEQAQAFLLPIGETE